MWLTPFQSCCTQRVLAQIIQPRLVDVGRVIIVSPLQQFKSTKILERDDLPLVLARTFVHRLRLHPFTRFTLKSFQISIDILQDEKNNNRKKNEHTYFSLFFHISRRNCTYVCTIRKNHICISLVSWNFCTLCTFLIRVFSRRKHTADWTCERKRGPFMIGLSCEVRLG